VDLSIVVPMYNESSRVESGLKEILSYLQKAQSSAEVILVDDGSRDDTVARVEALLGRIGIRNAKILKLGINRGKGAAVREGMRSATGKVRLFADADNATPIEELERLVPLVSTPTTIVIGSRALADSDIEQRQAWWRQLMGKTFNLFPKLLLGLPFRDTQCGFKLFGEKAAQICFAKQKIERFAFDVELLWIARLEGFDVREVPVRWRHVSQSRVNPLIDSLKMARDALMIRRMHAR
jgi:dolichyl-phosphate beta-glucosyltransferase